MIALLVGVFFVGMLAGAAEAASHRTSYRKIFGHSTSCVLGAASINDSTNKAGSRTVNRVGCDVNNDPRAVPPGYLGAEASLSRMVGGSPVHFCSGVATAYNSATASAVEITAALTVNSNCPLGGYYRTFGGNLRMSDAGVPYTISPEIGNYKLD